jgi:hypothetical protein
MTTPSLRGLEALRARDSQEKINQEKIKEQATTQKKAPRKQRLEQRKLKHVKKVAVIKKIAVDENTYKVGQKVEAKFRSRGKWCTATVLSSKRTKSKVTYALKFDESGSKDEKCPVKSIRFLQQQTTTMTEASSDQLPSITELKDEFINFMTQWMPVFVVLSWLFKNENVRIAATCLQFFIVIREYFFNKWSHDFHSSSNFYIFWMSVGRQLLTTGRWRVFQHFSIIHDLNKRGYLPFVGSYDLSHLDVGIESSGLLFRIAKVFVLFVIVVPLVQMYLYHILQLPNNSTTAFLFNMAAFYVFSVWYIGNPMLHPFQNLVGSFNINNKNRKYSELELKGARAGLSQCSYVK